MIRSLMLFAALAAGSAVSAEDVIIRDATVHTGTAAGKLANADVHVRDGRIVAVGADVAAPAAARVIDAKGRELTAGLFGGLTSLGIEEVSLEPSTVDSAYAPGAQTPPLALDWRPEFDASDAFNPRSAPIGVARVEGITWTMLAPGSLAGGNFVAGQGAAVTLDGRFDAIVPASRSLFVNIGASSLALAGGSRAAETMLLEQALREAFPGTGLRDSDYRLLTPAGRETLRRYMPGGRVVFRVERAAEVRRAIAIAQKHGFKAVIAGGAEAWVVAGELARANVPVLLDALVNLPANFDQLGARLDNAALLHSAGVRIAFSQAGDATHNARKIRQLAGNAVAHGLPWDAALAALTSNPAQIFGVANHGTIAAGAAADLVLWSGDPLEVTTVAEQVWIDGRAIEMVSRQTLLRDRYLRRAGIGR